MSNDDPKTTPNRRDVLVGLTAGITATAITAPVGAAPGGQPGPPQGPPAGGPPGLAADADALSEVIVAGWNAWLATAEYADSSIQASTVSGGRLTSPVDVALVIEDGLLAEGVEADGASKLAGAAADAWEEWADDWSLPDSEAFPDFVAVAAPEAPPAEGDAVALQPDASAGYSQLTSSLQDALSDAVIGKGPIKGGHPTPILVHAIAWRVGQRVEDWNVEAMVEGILGGGPVPTFAPPYVPVGPVVAGDNISTPGHVLRVTQIPGPRPLPSEPNVPSKQL